MAKVAIGFKIMIIWLYNGLASLVMQSAVTTTQQGGSLESWHIFFLILFFLLVIFMPEILYIVSKEFKKLVIEGVMDGDGVVHMKDLKETVILYVSLWSMRIFIGFSLATIFGTEIPFYIYITPLIGSFGTAGLAVFAKKFK